MKTHSITISLDNDLPLVKPDNLLVKPGDEIEWKSDDGQPFKVFFRHGTPFKTDGEKLDPKEKGSVSRTVAKKGDNFRAYKYSVIFHNEILDPIIIVDQN